MAIYPPIFPGDKDWKEYFENAKRMIEERDKLKA